MYISQSLIEGWDMLVNIKTFELLLKKKGMTQVTLAERAKVGAKTVGRIRRGEELRAANAQKIANALGVTIETLLAPPSAELGERAGRAGELHRYVSDLRGMTLNALTLTTMRYGLSEKTILEAAPYMFTILAEMSLKDRLDRLETWRESALEAVERGPVRPWASLDSIRERIEALYATELASIQRRDLSGGFEGDRDLLDLGPEDPDHAFFAYLSDLMAECGFDNPDLPEWDNVSSDSMTPTSFGPYQEIIETFLNPENEDTNEFSNVLDDGYVLIMGGDILLREMPEALFKHGTGPERRSWVGPRIKEFWKATRLSRAQSREGEESDA
jgi:transcriptional regulator with XRE-family HTH domain